MDKKYIFKKPYKCEYGVIPIGSEIVLFRNFVYFNGGMVMSSYAEFLRKFIDDKNLREEYIDVQNVEKNEF